MNRIGEKIIFPRIKKMWEITYKIQKRYANGLDYYKFRVLFDRGEGYKLYSRTEYEICIDTWEYHKKQQKKQMKGFKMPKQKSNIQDFADTIKDNPKEIIDWAKREIAEYKKLIKILEKRIK